MVGIVEEQRTTADGQGQQGQVQAGVGTCQGGQQAGSADDANGGRAGRHRQQHGDQPPQNQRRECRLLGQVHDGIANLGAGQHLLESAAAGNDHDDRGNRLQAFAQRIAQLLGVATARQYQAEACEQHAQQHGDQWVAKEAGQFQQRIALGQQHFGNGMHQHQDRRQQRGQHADQYTGAGLAVGLLSQGELVQQCLIGAGAHAPGNEHAVQRAAQDHGRDRGKEAVKHGRPNRGLEHGDGGQWARVRRDHAMHGRQGGNHWHSHVHIGRALKARLALQLACHAENQRQHDHQAHLKEHRDADDEGHQHHRPGDQPVGGAFEDHIGDLFGNASIRQDRAQHGAKGNHHPDRTQRLASTGEQVRNDTAGLHMGREAHANGHHQQGQKRVHLQARYDQRHQHQNTDQGGQQQLNI